MKHLTEFLDSAKRYRYLKFPLRYSGESKCAISTANIEKYILVQNDAAPTKEPEFSAHKGRLVAHSEGASLNFLYGFISTAIYLVHRCVESGDLRTNLLTSFNKRGHAG